MMGWNNWNHMMGGYGFLGGGLISLLILAALVVVVVLLFRSTGGNVGTASGSVNSTPNTQRQNPIEILEMRYAKGEIDRDEYLERRRDLESSSTVS